MPLRIEEKAQAIQAIQDRIHSITLQLISDDKKGQNFEVVKAAGLLANLFAAKKGLES